MMSKHNNGGIFVISAPSGSGKTTLIRHLMKIRNDLVFAVSHTTRAPRPGELHGHDYYFISETVFQTMVRDQQFLEWARVHDHHYGTAKSEIQRLKKTGRHILMDIDVQGALQVQRTLPEAVFIMIVPPDFETLKHRLKQRGDLASDQLERRLGNARKELRMVLWFDFIVINDELSDAVRQLDAIITATLCRNHQHRLFRSAS